MTQLNAAITAVHGYVPEDIMTNQDLEKLVDTNDEWIRSRTGIEKRHILKGEGKGTSDMAVEAVRGLCEKRGIDPNEIDLLSTHKRVTHLANRELEALWMRHAFVGGK